MSEREYVRILYQSNPSNINIYITHSIQPLYLKEALVAWQMGVVSFIRCLLTSYLTYS